MGVYLYKILWVRRCGQEPCEFKASSAMVRMLGFILSAKESPECLQQGVTKSGVLVVRSLLLHHGNKLEEKQETMVHQDCRSLHEKGKMGPWHNGDGKRQQLQGRAWRWSMGVDAGGKRGSLCARHMLPLLLSVQTSHLVSTNDVWKLFLCGMTT